MYSDDRVEDFDRWRIGYLIGLPHRFRVDFKQVRDRSLEGACDFLGCEIMRFGRGHFFNELRKAVPSKNLIRLTK
jgi:hypothetical protein